MYGTLHKILVDLPVFKLKEGEAFYYITCYTSTDGFEDPLTSKMEKRTKKSRNN